MITGIPAYQTPMEQSISCTCSLRYLVYFGGGIGDAEDRARERAELLDAKFVDVRLQPWLICECGLSLDFVCDVTAMIR